MLRRFVCASMIRPRKAAAWQRTFARHLKDARDKRCYDAVVLLLYKAANPHLMADLRARFQRRALQECYSTPSPVPCGLWRGRRSPQGTRQAFQKEGSVSAKLIPIIAHHRPCSTHSQKYWKAKYVRANGWDQYPDSPPAQATRWPCC